MGYNYVKVTVIPRQNTLNRPTTGHKNANVSDMLNKRTQKRPTVGYNYELFLVC